MSSSSDGELQGFTRLGSASLRTPDGTPAHAPGAHADKVQQLASPDPLNTLATYPHGVLTDSKNAALAKKFFDYILSPDAQTVLAKYGFIPVVGQ